MSGLRTCILVAMLIGTNSLGYADAQAPAGVENCAVSFLSHGVTLSGTLVLPPRGSTVIAAAVFVDGAGRGTRNLGMATVLARLHVAVLVYDKRGVGQSGGIYAGPEVGTNNVTAENLALLADDAAAAFAALRAASSLRSVPLGFVGISQAGWIVPQAALKVRNAEFMVLWSGAVETTHEDMRFERLAAEAADFWDHNTHEQVQATLKSAPDSIEWPDFDPTTFLQRLRIPGLWLYGGRDRNVNVDLSVERLNSLIARGHANFQYRVYPTYDHFLGHYDIDVLGPTVDWIRGAVAAPGGLRQKNSVKP